MHYHTVLFNNFSDEYILIIQPSLNTDEELTVNAARALKPGSVSTELKLRSEKEKSITCGFFPQSYGPYEVREKTFIL